MNIWGTQSRLWWHVLWPLRVKFKQHCSLVWTPTPRLQRNDIMQVFILFKNFVRNWEKAPLLRKVIEKRKATPSALGCPQSLQGLLWDPRGDWGWVPAGLRLTKYLFGWPHPVLSFFWRLVWLAEWRNTCLLYFHLWRCNSKPTYTYVLQLLMSCCLTLSGTFPGNIVKRQWQFWC